MRTGHQCRKAATWESKRPLVGRHNPGHLAAAIPKNTLHRQLQADITPVKSPKRGDYFPLSESTPAEVPRPHPASTVLKASLPSVFFQIRKHLFLLHIAHLPSAQPAPSEDTEKAKCCEMLHSVVDTVNTPRLSLSEKLP